MLLSRVSRPLVGGLAFQLPPRLRPARTDARPGEESIGHGHRSPAHVYSPCVTTVLQAESSLVGISAPVSSAQQRERMARMGHTHGLTFSSRGCNWQTVLRNCSTAMPVLV